MITGISERFDQPGYKMYEKVEQLLIKVIKQESYEECMTDFDAALLKLHLDVLVSDFPVSLQKSATVMDIRKHVQEM